MTDCVKKYAGIDFDQVSSDEEAKALAKEHHIEFESREQLCANPQIYEMMKERIDTLQQQLAHYEQVKRFTLLPQHFTIERGELTNTLKIKRRVLNTNYAKEIDAMYAE